MCHKKIMRKRSSDHLSDEPPKKRISPGGNVLPVQMSAGEVLTDITGRQWKLGKTIGYGGFGEIYLASDNIKEPVRADAPYVIKVESHTNGPLFVEINCLLRIAKLDMIKSWESDHKKRLGMPHYVASGSHTVNNEKLRFLVLPRFEEDLEKIFVAKQKRFNLKTVIIICTQILDILEYIHGRGYVHCDIKASNILHSIRKDTTTREKLQAPEKTWNVESSLEKLLCRGCNPTRSCRNKLPIRKHNRNLRPQHYVDYKEQESCEDMLEQLNMEMILPQKKEHQEKKQESNQVVLMDYGLATKYRHSDGRHKQYCNDERRAHAGTILFCSIDAHLGATSRRSDLESLGYNVVYWLTSDLPWSGDINSPETVQTKKEQCFNHLDSFLQSCFLHDCPRFILDYFKYVKSLSFESKPDYGLCRKLLQDGLKEYGYKEDGRLDFDNAEGWGRRTLYSSSSPRKQAKKSQENIHYMKQRNKKSGRAPLTSNIFVDKPVLRKNSVKRTVSSSEEVQRNSRKKIRKNLCWSNTLLDPEELLRHNKKSHERERKLTETSDSSCPGSALQNLDIWTLNPTAAMLEVFNKSRDKNANYNGLNKGKADGLDIQHKDGFTPAMDLIRMKMRRRRLKELSQKTEVNFADVPLKKTRSVTLNDRKRTQTSCTYVAKEVVKRRPRMPRILSGYGLRG